MDLLKKTQTPFQETVLVLSVGLSVWSFVGVLLYFFSTNPSTYLFFGQWGFKAIAGSAFWLGYSFFLLPVVIFKTGQTVILKCESFRDVSVVYPKLFLKTAVGAVSLLLVSSFLDSVVAYFGIGFSDAKFVYGPGGFLGHAVGSWLYSSFGFGGVLVILNLVNIMSSQLTGEFSFADFLTKLEKGMSFFTKTVINHSSVFLRSFWEQVLIKLGRKSDPALDKLEFQIQQACERQKLHHAVEIENTAAVAGSALVASVADVMEQGLVVNASSSATDWEVQDHESKTDRKKSSSKPKIKIVVDNTQAQVSNLDNEKSKGVAVSDEETLSDEENQAAQPLPEDIKITLWKKSYSYPSKSLLKQSKKIPALSATAKKQQADLVQNCLAGFGLEGKVVAVHAGVRLNMFEFEPSVGVKVSKIQALTNDLALSLGASSIRILAPIPGKNTVGIEIPSKSPGSLCLGDLIEAAQKNKSAILPFALGKDVYGDVLVEDLAKMPHLLVAGTTGSGKSVFTNTLISSLIYSLSPRDLRFIMVDPKMIELTPYNGIPHLLKPVISDVEESKNALIWAENEMDRRYKVFAELGARNIESFNQKLKSLNTKSLSRKLGKDSESVLEHMPYIVIVIDELADLMITQGKEVEKPITRIAQKARACGIHLVLATQRPSAEIVTGLIKTNFPSRIAFKVSSSIDSRTILDTAGAEKLLGQGDMLYLPNGRHIVRVQGAYLSEEEVQKVVKSVVID